MFQQADFQFNLRIRKYLLGEIALQFIDRQGHASPAIDLALAVILFNESEVPLGVS
jgi:hypothetical protein